MAKNKKGNNDLRSPTEGQGAGAFLFVYGTLRKDFGLALMQKIAKRLSYVGVGKIKAVLYNLGDYPGAVQKDNESEIAGDVFEVHNTIKVLTVLDEYEGDEYKREKVIVRMTAGEEINAWVYWYTGEVEEGQHIMSDDYLDYLKNKKDRFV